MIKSLLLGVILLLIATGVSAANRGAETIAGVWRTKTGGYIQIYQDHSDWTGRIVGSSSGKARYDTQDPDPAKRGQRLLGMDILKGLKYEGNGEYDGGHIYDPNNGKTYKVEITARNASTLHVRGYIGISLFGKTQTWTRIDPHTSHVHQELLR